MPVKESSNVPTPMRCRKPRPLNSLWADCQCYEVAGERFVSVKVESELTAKQAARLAGWLAAATLWEMDE